MNAVTEEIKQLKKEKNAVILAHYYVEDAVQEIADYIGDSYYLSRLATETTADVVVFCGVGFMGESAKVLNPGKKVLMPDMSADCPMAHMADIAGIEKLRAEYEDLAVVCYINSTAELKAHADVCVTSSNALKIVKALPNKHILFIPDDNLGHFIAEQVPEKEFLYQNGHCPVHKAIAPEAVKKAKQEHPQALVLAHPECLPEVSALADYVGSTSGIIDYATKSDAEEFVICTETGVFYELKKKNPGKKFYPASAHQICPDMKKITLEKVRDVLKNESNAVTVEKELSEICKENSNNTVIDFDSKMTIKENSIGLGAMVTFIGLYLGIIFLISCAAILALKELSESSDNVEKFNMLRKIGVDEKMINKALFRQIGIFFMFPLLVAIIHSVFGIKFCNFLLSAFGAANLLSSIIGVAIFIVAIYGGYFLVTYICSKNIIKEK